VLRQENPAVTNILTDGVAAASLPLLHTKCGRTRNRWLVSSESAANDHASLPIAYQLYLPEIWANDPLRRAKVGVPAVIGFETKTAIALGQLRQALAAGVPVGIVLDDPAYGDETGFRVGVADLGLCYVLDVRSGTSVCPSGTGPLPPAPWSGRGGRPTRLVRPERLVPNSIATIRRQLSVRLVTALPRCPCRLRQHHRQPANKKMT
jgi:SRSO17 transposase